MFVLIYILRCSAFVLLHCQRCTIRTKVDMPGWVTRWHLEDQWFTCCWLFEYQQQQFSCWTTETICVVIEEVMSLISSFIIICFLHVDELWVWSSTPNLYTTLLQCTFRSIISHASVSLERRSWNVKPLVCVNLVVRFWHIRRCGEEYVGFAKYHKSFVILSKDLRLLHKHSTQVQRFRLLTLSLLFAELRHLLMLNKYLTEPVRVSLN